MSKRSIEQTNIKALTLNLGMMIQRISIEKRLSWKTKKILEKIKEINEDIDISEHEVHKFLNISHSR